MGDEGSGRSFGERLRWLMETCPQASGRSWTPGAVTKALTTAGHPVSPSLTLKPSFSQILKNDLSKLHLERQISQRTMERF